MRLERSLLLIKLNSVVQLHVILLFRFSFLLKKNTTRALADMVGGRDTCEGDSGNALFE